MQFLSALQLRNQRVADVIFLKRGGNCLFLPSVFHCLSSLGSIVAVWVHSSRIHEGARIQVCGIQKSSQFCWGGVACLFWDSEDLHFAFVDVALNLQCFFPMMNFAVYKFYLSRGLSI